MNDRTLFRWGSSAAIVGGILAIVFNVMHPRPESYDDQIIGEIQMAGGSEAWIGIHVGIFAAFLLIAFGLYAVARSMKGGPAEGIARLALGSLLLSTPIALATMLVDGYTVKALADAAMADREMLAAATAGGHIGWALFAGTALLSLGVTPAIFGWAIGNDGRYPAWLGWAGILFGLGGITTGLMAIYGGSTQAFWTTFTIVSGLLTLWTIGLGVALARRAPTAVTIPAGSATRQTTAAR